MAYLHAGRYGHLVHQSMVQKNENRDCKAPISENGDSKDYGKTALVAGGILLLIAIAAITGHTLPDGHLQAVHLSGGAIAGMVIGSLGIGAISAGIFLHSESEPIEEGEYLEDEGSEEVEIPQQNPNQIVSHQIARPIQIAGQEWQLNISATGPDQATNQALATCREKFEAKVQGYKQPPQSVDEKIALLEDLRSSMENVLLEMASMVDISTWIFSVSTQAVGRVTIDKNGPKIV